MVSRWWSYLRSIPAIVRGCAEPLAVLRRLAEDRGGPGVVRLRDGLELEYRDRLELWLIMEICVAAEYERGLSPLPPEATVVDVGAGLGELAVRIAAGRPQARVIAVEPAPDSHALLERNLARNRVTNVVTVRAAVVPDERPRTLDLSRPGPLRSLSTGHGPGSVEVPVVTLPALFERHGIERCDLLKVDCEGGEEDLLGSVPDAVLRRVRRVVVETHRVGAPEALAARLEAVGFRVRVVPSSVHRHLALVYGERD